jgi:acetylornithine/N-succinyldiaminopimelate aminotransferase
MSTGTEASAAARDDSIRDATTYLMDNFRRLPIVLQHGRGAKVFDSDGREYLDLAAGIAVNALGHCHPAVMDALAEQASRLIHSSNLYYSEPQIALARRLVEISFPGRVFFGNSGAEANECAIKIARKWGQLHRDGAYEILTLEGSFHGRTLATLAATGQAKYSRAFTPLPSGFHHVPFSDLDALRAATKPTTVAVMLELILGEGGMLLHPDGYLESVRAWCDEQNLLLIFDEVQTGIGRTGTWFAYQQYELTPDLLTAAKALGAGVPIGACIASHRADVFEPGDHGTTFGGNPLACAVALEVLRVIDEEGLLEHAREMGALFAEGLKSIPHVYDVRGLGLMQAFSLNPSVARKLELAVLEQGLIVNAISEETIRLVPPLVITAEQVETALRALQTAIEAVTHG